MLLSLSCSFTALSAWPKHPAVSPYEISIHCMCGWGWVVVSLSRGHGGVILNVPVHTHHVAAESPPLLSPNTSKFTSSSCVSEWRKTRSKRFITLTLSAPDPAVMPLLLLLFFMTTAWVCIVSGGSLNIITARWCSPLSPVPMTSSQ